MQHLFLTDDQFSIRICPAQSLSDAIEPCGFRFVDKRIRSASFAPLLGGSRGETVRLAAIADDQHVETAEVLDWMARHKLRPTHLMEMLALAASQPDVYIRRYLCALGSPLINCGYPLAFAGCSLMRERRLRFVQVRAEPRWSFISDCFPCVAC